MPLNTPCIPAVCDKCHELRHFDITLLCGDWDSEDLAADMKKEGWRWEPRAVPRAVLCPACLEQGADAAEARRIAETYAPGTYGCHEALHMAAVARDFVEEHLLDHPAIGLNSNWKTLADQACTALFDLYQAIGKVHLSKEDQK